MKSLFDNVVYGVKETRGFLKLNVMSLAFTVTGIVLVLTVLGAAVIVPILVNYVGLSNFTELLVRIAR